MKTIPVPVRLDGHLQRLLRDGARRTPHKKQELIRLTLRRHLPEVIEQEAVASSPRRITNVDPWPETVVRKAYRRMGRDWDALEDAAIRAQGRPGFND
jgi:hypothetical protein